MAVDYREVDQFLRVSANQLPYRDMLFQQLGGQLYYAKVDNLWGYHQLKLDQQSDRVTAIITPCGCIASYHAPYEFRRLRASIKPEWLIKYWKDIISMVPSFTSMTQSSMKKIKKFSWKCWIRFSGEWRILICVLLV